MVVFALVTVFLGACLAALGAAMAGASLGMIGLAYVAGGWSGLAVGLLALLMARAIRGTAPQPLDDAEETASAAAPHKPAFCPETL